MLFNTLKILYILVFNIFINNIQTIRLNRLLLLQLKISIELIKKIIKKKGTDDSENEYV